jgi:hypothetical protein
MTGSVVVLVDAPPPGMPGSAAVVFVDIAEARE